MAQKGSRSLRQGPEGREEERLQVSARRVGCEPESRVQGSLGAAALRWAAQDQLGGDTRVGPVSAPLLAYPLSSQTASDAPAARCPLHLRVREGSLELL